MTFEMRLKRSKSGPFPRKPHDVADDDDYDDDDDDDINDINIEVEKEDVASQIFEK